MKESKIQSYIKRAKVVSENSPDAETKVGSILVSRSTGSVISEGFNGFVRGANDELIPNTRPRKYDYIIHAEENLVCNASRNGIRTDNCFVVQTLSPCTRCARLLFQAGIDTVYCTDLYHASKFEDLDVKLTIEVLNGFYKLTIKPA